jgi:uncharacterized protein
MLHHTCIGDAPIKHPKPIQHIMKKLVCAACAAFCSSTFAINISQFNVSYGENFNSLGSSGTSSTLPTGWALIESGTGGNTTYTAGTGSGTGGDTYSFGASGNSERALGTLQTGSVIPSFGASFQNATLATIASLQIAYTGEQWRLGAVGRSDRLDFQYSFDATSLTTGTWNDFNGLDFIAPITSGSTGALDGNAAGNRTLLSGTLSGLTWAQGGTLWLRWTDFNATGSDDGLAIDDFSITAPEVSTSVPDSAPGLAGWLALLAVLALAPRPARPSAS